MDAAALLAGLDDDQRRAVTTPVSPLRVLAVPGSGKTRVLTRRIAHRAATGEVDPRHVLAITFTRKAAAELQTRLRTLGLRDVVEAGTFHSVAYRLLRARWADLGVRTPTVLASRRQLVAKVLPPRVGGVQGGAGTGSAGSGASAAAAAEVGAEIDWAKARLVTPGEYADAARRARRRPALGPAGVAAVYERYEREKRNRGLVDFDDLLWLCAQELERDRSFAAAVRWRHRHLFVDEFQDVNPLQLRLLRAWAGTSTDVCVVGDPDQAIYGWNGADPSYLLGFEERFPGCETVSLRTNYRSTPEVLALARALLGTELVAVSPGGPVPTVQVHGSDLDEATAIARAVRDGRRPGAPWSHQAVLVRTNAQAAVVHDALARAGVPGRVRADPRGPDLSAGDEPLARDTGDDDPDTREIARRAEERHAEERRAGAVDVATFHAAKGLEWPTVHIAGLEAGLVPIAHARSAAAEAEERRLLYVAVTRAQRELHLSWASTRRLGATEPSTREPSPYLPPLEDAIALLEREARPTDPGPHLLRHRQVLAAPAEPLVEALRSWRAAAARAAEVSASVILTDTALEAVASARPHDREALAQVSGMGPVKAARFGDAVLDLVARHPGENARA